MELKLIGHIRSI